METNDLQAELDTLGTSLVELLESNGEDTASQDSTVLKHLETVRDLTLRAEKLAPEDLTETLVDLLMMKAGLFGLLNKSAAQDDDFQKQKEHSQAELEATQALDKLQPQNPLTLVKIAELQAHLASVESHLDSPVEVILSQLELAIEGYMSQIEMDPAINNPYYQTISLNGLAEAIANQVNLLDGAGKLAEAKTACSDFLSFAKAVQASDFEKSDEFPDLTEFTNYLEEL